MKAIKIYLDDEYYELLKSLAEQKELSISALARELILKELGVKKDKENKAIEVLNKRLNELEKEVREMSKTMKKLISNFNKLVSDYKRTKECLEKLHSFQWRLYCEQ
nr:hypothetical protein [uncultured bacterium]